MKEKERQRKKEEAEQQKKAKQDAKEAAKRAKEQIDSGKRAKVTQAKESTLNRTTTRKRSCEETEVQQSRKRPCSKLSISRAATQRKQPTFDSDFTALQLRNDLNDSLKDVELGIQNVDTLGVLKSGKSRVGRAVNLPTRFR